MVDKEIKKKSQNTEVMKFHYLKTEKAEVKWKWLNFINFETDGAPFMSHVKLKTKIFHRFCMRVKNCKVFLPFHD